MNSGGYVESTLKAEVRRGHLQTHSTLLEGNFEGAIFSLCFALSAAKVDEGSDGVVIIAPA